MRRLKPPSSPGCLLLKIGCTDHALHQRDPMIDVGFVMLFTDGLFEVEAPDDKIYSRERLMAAVRERVRLPSAKLLSELLGEIRQFSKRSEFSDDVCLVGMDVSRLCLT